LGLIKLPCNCQDVQLCFCADTGIRCIS
jgi:hypothetical protein